MVQPIVVQVQVTQVDQLSDFGRQYGNMVLAQIQHSDMIQQGNAGLCWRNCVVVNFVKGVLSISNSLTPIIAIRLLDRSTLLARLKAAWKTITISKSQWKGGEPFCTYDFLRWNLGYVRETQIHFVAIDALLNVQFFGGLGHDADDVGDDLPTI